MLLGQAASMLRCSLLDDHVHQIAYAFKRIDFARIELDAKPLLGGELSQPGTSRAESVAVSTMSLRINTSLKMSVSAA